MCPGAKKSNEADESPRRSGPGSSFWPLKGVYLTDGDARTLGTSAGYEMLTGLRESELVGHHMAELVARGYFDQSVTLLVLKERKPITIPQRILKTGRLVVVTGNPVFAEDGSIVMVVTTVEPSGKGAGPSAGSASRQMLPREGASGGLGEPDRSCGSWTQAFFARNGGGLPDFLTLFPEFVFRSPKMTRLLERALRVAGSDCTLLIQGESGVGKDLLARAIHRLSGRREGPFVKVNCAAIPDELMESEMFGYERGAFTGARSSGKKGLIEVANKGTLVLDEVAELSPRLQAKLLQVLQEKQFYKVGSTSPTSVDVRFIGVSNKDLREMVREGRFREDLYYRLSIVCLRVPPLRERPEDITPMALAFLEKHCLKYGTKKVFDPPALAALSNYEWPGNVRELEAVVEQCVLLTVGNTIRKEDLPETICFGLQKEAPFADRPLKHLIERYETELIERAIKHYGSADAAAKALGVHRTTLARKLSKARRPSAESHRA